METNDGCQGHEPTHYQPQGVTFYCDGSCRIVKRERIGSEDEFSSDLRVSDRERWCAD